MFGKLGSQALIATEASSSLLTDVITNISNMKSIGYKKGETTFTEALNGELIKHTTRDFSQGPLRQTTEALDLAIEGKGFFEVEFPNGQRAYTRVGNFHLSNEGELMTQEGYRVLPQIEQSRMPIQPIFVREDVKQTGTSGLNINVSEVGLNLKVSTPKLIVPSHLPPEISEDGTIYGADHETGEKARLGRISVVLFNNPQGLESIGKGYFIETKESGNPIEVNAGSDAPTKVKQSFLEHANVNVATEFMNLAAAKNLLTAQLKILKSIDKIYENVHFTISRAV